MYFLHVGCHQWNCLIFVSLKGNNTCYLLRPSSDIDLKRWFGKMDVKTFVQWWLYYMANIYRSFICWYVLYLYVTVILLFLTSVMSFLGDISCICIYWVFYFRWFCTYHSPSVLTFCFAGVELVLTPHQLTEAFAILCCCKASFQRFHRASNTLIIINAYVSLACYIHSHALPVFRFMFSQFANASPIVKGSFIAISFFLA